VDLFYTRLAPARKYDSLEDDFSYGLLIVAILALLTGSVAMHFITKKTMLSQKWA
jgi:multisubunit Na+/H+ antiporter MnhG subunit